MSWGEPLYSLTSQFIIPMLGSLTPRRGRGLPFSNGSSQALSGLCGMCLLRVLSCGFLGPLDHRSEGSTGFGPPHLVVPVAAPRGHCRAPEPSSSLMELFHATSLSGGLDFLCGSRLRGWRRGARRFPREDIERTHFLLGS